jgi:4-hydroxybenzoate polyprenyltransferase
MVLAGQLSVGWSNDAIDHERDEASHRLDKPVAVGVVTLRTVWTAAWAAVAACVVLSFWYDPVGGPVHLVAVGSAWTYNAVLKRTPLSWLPYAVSFGLLPVFVVLGLPGSPLPPLWAVAAGALLGVGAHFANVLPDLADDAATGVRGLPHRLGARPTVGIAMLALVGATVLVALGPTGGLDAVGAVALVTVAVLVAVASAGATRGRLRVPFLTAIGVAVVDVALLLARGGALG